MQVGNLMIDGSNTHYVVQGYRKKGRAVQADEPRIARDKEHCLRLAQQIATTRHAVIAFSRTGDADTGDFDDPVILARHGDVPEMG
ncbi:MAG TPA: hypothetical protein VGN60_07710 [Devosia sp.]|jgi:hypothetical protein|nr:hypothetical protein [Devosia sp.]